MEYSLDEPPTPRFGYSKDNKTLFKEFPEKKIPKYSKDISQCEKNKEKLKKSQTEKSKSKERSKNKNGENKKRKSKEKSKNKHKSPKSEQKNISSISFKIEKKCKNPFDIFSEKFLLEKELAFQKFLMNEDADYLDN